MMARRTMEQIQRGAPFARLKELRHWALTTACFPSHQVLLACFRIRLYAESAGHFGVHTMSRRLNCRGCTHYNQVALSSCWAQQGSIMSSCALSCTFRTSWFVISLMEPML
jgi:hypothetical protein